MLTCFTPQEKTACCTFNDDVGDFSAYLRSTGKVNSHSLTNYLSWLRFLSQSHAINGTLTSDDVDNIIIHERKALGTRTKYNSVKDLTNFRSALNAYLAYLNSNFTAKRRQQEQEAEETVASESAIAETVRIQIIEARVGQGLFRQRLIDYWHACAVSRCNAVGLLTASHIKPWRVSDNRERLDVHNGLLLLPNIDQLFDKGYITFNERGVIKISSFITPSQYKAFGITPESQLQKIEPQHQAYLDYHRHECFIGM